MKNSFPGDMFEKLKSETFKIDFSAPCQPKIGNFKTLKSAIDTDELQSPWLSVHCVIK